MRRWGKGSAYDMMIYDIGIRQTLPTTQPNHSHQLKGEELCLDPIRPPRPPTEQTASRVDVLVPIMGGQWSQARCFAKAQSISVRSRKPSAIYVFFDLRNHHCSLGRLFKKLPLPSLNLTTHMSEQNSNFKFPDAFCSWNGTLNTCYDREPCA